MYFPQDVEEIKTEFGNIYLLNSNTNLSEESKDEIGKFIYECDTFFINSNIFNNIHFPLYNLKDKYGFEYKDYDVFDDELYDILHKNIHIKYFKDEFIEMIEHVKDIFVYNEYIPNNIIIEIRKIIGLIYAKEIFSEVIFELVTMNVKFLNIFISFDENTNSYFKDMFCKYLNDLEYDFMINQFEDL
jgi:hypothetical protein